MKFEIGQLIQLTNPTPLKFRSTINNWLTHTHTGHAYIGIVTGLTDTSIQTQCKVCKYTVWWTIAHGLVEPISTTPLYISGPTFNYRIS